MATCAAKVPREREMAMLAMLPKERERETRNLVRETKMAKMANSLSLDTLG